MLLRKKGKIEKKEMDLKFDSNGIPFDIFGEGHGLEDLKKLLKKVDKELGKKSSEDLDWEECDSKGNILDDSDNSRSVEIEEEDVLECFILDNTKALNSGSFKCLICNDNKKISPMNIDIHFSKKHKKEYEKSEYNEISKNNNNLIKILIFDIMF